MSRDATSWTENGSGTELIVQSNPTDGNQAAPGAGPTPSIRWTLAGLSLCVLLSSLGISIANVALPTLAQAFGASFQQVQWVVLAYLIAVTAIIVSAGRLGDIVGRRRLVPGIGPESGQPVT